MAAAVGQKEAKYTQGFSFQHDEAGYERSRQVVERACTALATLMQELFVRVERQVFQQLKLEGLTLPEQRSLEQLSEIVRARPMLEQAVLTAVVCAFAALEDQARGNQANGQAIEQALAVFKGRVRDSRDLVSLLQVQDKITHSNNCNRPLLILLNAQLVSLFGLKTPGLHNSPLGPATLVGGLLAGLLCMTADVAAKHLLLEAFEQEFLGRLSMLLNSITLRLEEEGVLVRGTAGFDEQDCGPIGVILQNQHPRDNPALAAEVAKLALLLQRQQEFVAIPQQTADRLSQRLASHARGKYVEILSDLYFIRRRLEPILWRAEVHQQETVALVATRRAVAEQLNGQLEGVWLPPAVQEFLCQQWPNVLFDIAVLQGMETEAWSDAMTLAQQLLESVTPITSDVQRSQFGKQVSALVKNLRESLEQAGYPFSEMSAFFLQLKQLHLANLQEKLAELPRAPWQPLSLEGYVPGPVQMVSEADRAFYTQLQAMVG